MSVSQKGNERIIHCTTAGTDKTLRVPQRGKLAFAQQITSTFKAEFIQELSEGNEPRTAGCDRQGYKRVKLRPRPERTAGVLIM